MAASIPQRRKMTAREAAAKTGVSERTIRRIVAEPRDEFVQRAAQRRARAVELRVAGLKYIDIATEIGCTIGTVGRLIHEARRNGEFPAKPETSEAQEAS